MSSPSLPLSAGVAPSPRRAATREFLDSARVYLLLMGYLAAVKLAITYLLPAAFRAPAQVAVFRWEFIAAVTAAGLVGVWISLRTGFPGLWDPRVDNRSRLRDPALLGALFGIVAILVDVATGWTRLVAATMGIPTIHIAFPASLLIYPGGAIIVDVLYYLVPIPLLVWLVSSVAIRGRWQEQVFWVVGVLAAAIEPVTQAGGLGGHRAILALTMAEDFALNLAQVYFFRRAGFLAPVVLRVVFYLVWHVGWGLRG